MAWRARFIPVEPLARRLPALLVPSLPQLPLDPSATASSDLVRIRPPGGVGGAATPGSARTRGSPQVNGVKPNKTSARKYVMTFFSRGTTTRPSSGTTITKGTGITKSSDRLIAVRIHQALTAPVRAEGRLGGVPPLLSSKPRS
jgi:hypothetical protein